MGDETYMAEIPEAAQAAYNSVVFALRLYL